MGLLFMLCWLLAQFSCGGRTGPPLGSSASLDLQKQRSWSHPTPDPRLELLVHGSVFGIAATTHGRYIHTPFTAHYTHVYCTTNECSDGDPNIMTCMVRMTLFRSSDMSLWHKTFMCTPLTNHVPDICKEKNCVIAWLPSTSVLLDVSPFLFRLFYGRSPFSIYLSLWSFQSHGLLSPSPACNSLSLTCCR